MTHINNNFAEAVTAEKTATLMKSTIERLYRKASEDGNEGFYEFYIDNPKEAVCYVALGIDQSHGYCARPGITWNGHKPASVIVYDRPTTVEAWIHARRDLEALNEDFKNLVTKYDDVGLWTRKLGVDETGTYHYHFCYVPEKLLAAVFTEIYPLDKKEEEPVNKPEKDVDFTKLYLEFERKYNPYPCEMSRSEAFRRAYADNLISEELLERARAYYGSLWNYVGD